MNVAVAAAGTAKPRSGWFAALLSVVCPGLGHFYAMDLRGARRWGVALVAVVILGQVLLRMPPRSWAEILGASALTVAALAVCLGSAASSWRAARSGGAPKLTRWHRWYVYLAVPVLLQSVVAGAALIAPLAWRTWSIRSASMEPTLMLGDHVLAWDRYFDGHPPRRGDVAVFAHPRNTRVFYVDRIVGIPGDRIRFDGGTVIVNGEPWRHEPAAAADEFLEHRPDGRIHRIRLEGSLAPHPPEFLVPAGAVFAMGDNRNNSLDSRFREVGPIPVGNLQGRLMFVYWNRDWSRIGTWVE